MSEENYYMDKDIYILYMSAIPGQTANRIG